MPRGDEPTAVRGDEAAGHVHDDEVFGDDREVTLLLPLLGRLALDVILQSEDRHDTDGTGREPVRANELGTLAGHLRSLPHDAENYGEDEAENDLPRVLFPELPEPVGQLHEHDGVDVS